MQKQFKYYFLSIFFCLYALNSLCAQTGKARLTNAEISLTMPKIIQTTDYYSFGIPFPNNGKAPERQPYKFGGKEYGEMHGLNWYDFHARYYSDITLSFLTPDPLCEKYYWISPYAYCANNPVNRIDPTGMDWFWDTDKTRQYDPNITSQDQLKEGQTYIGATDVVKNKEGNVIEDYRKDGSIMFSNETSAYNRMWSQATKKNVEESGYALKNGKFLVMPDYKNKINDVDIVDYNYSIGKDGILSNGSGEKFRIVGNVHTHQDPSGNPEPSFWTGTGWGDAGHSKAMGGLPVITIGHDGKVHGAFWSVKDNGFRRIPGFGNRQDLLSGKTRLVPWLITYPTGGK
ncbi:MAG: RHS repeat-associated core domain-containing protein [Dysgonamonadaceae bacterium]|jgi:RHS repeat-associated protein|nr:RHS repeat-associated core domain-containing protein [Dysgonamonadaceae bacterium]